MNALIDVRNNFDIFSNSIGLSNQLYTPIRSIFIAVKESTAS
jgi:hypothetical protein